MLPMATSLIRRNRRRKAGMAVAVGASAALLAGVMVPAVPAHADLLPLSIGSIGDLPLPGITACDAGDTPADIDPLLESTADCTAASPWLLTALADGVLGLFAPDLAGLFTFGGMNGALATSGAEIRLGFGGNSVIIPGSATISGSGYNTALTVLGGNSKAQSDYILSAAVAIAALGGNADASSLFGVAVASAIGRPATQLDLGLVEFGSPRVENSAKAKALPFGIAIANVSLTPDEALGVNPDLELGDILDPEEWFPPMPRHRVSTVALGGITSAYRSIDGSKGAVCTALYGEARVHEDTLNSDGTVASSKRTNSCTSVLFIFQKQQNEDQHDGYVVYAIKNPFDIGLVSPFGDNVADLISGVTGGVLDLGDLNDLLAGRFVPEFQSDVLRIVMAPGGPKIESDLPQWLGGLFGSTSTGGTTTTVTPFTQRVSFGDDADSAAAGTTITSITGDDDESGQANDEAEPEKLTFGSQKKGFSGPAAGANNDVGLSSSGSSASGGTGSTGDQAGDRTGDDDDDDGSTGGSGIVSGGTTSAGDEQDESTGPSPSTDESTREALVSAGS